MSLLFLIKGHNIPVYGAIRITLASDSSSSQNSIYGNLVSIGSTCNLIGFDPSAICLISPNSVFIEFQGVSIDKDSNYTIIISGVNNPSDMQNSYANTITSYFDTSNTKIICQESFSIPTISVLPINSCEMQIKLDYITMGQYSNYYFSLGCNGVLRVNTEIHLIFPLAFGSYSNGDSIICSSDNNILTSNLCYIDLISLPNSLIIVAQANGLGSFSGLILQLENIQNPILPSPYSLNNIAAEFYSFSLLYGQTSNIYSISYASELASDSSIGQVYYNRLFSNANEESTYYFTIYKPVLSKYQLTTISIQFPDVFINNLGDSIVCGGYLTTSTPFQSTADLINYESWRQFRSNSSNFEILDCVVDGKTVIISNAYAYAMNNTYYVNIFIENVINPSISQSVAFSILYSYASFLDWNYTFPVVLNSGGLPDIIQIINISLTDYNVRRLATYSFTIQFTNGNFLNNYLSPLFSLELPSEYTQVLPSQPNFNCYNSLFLKKSTLPTCEIYSNEILLEPYPMNAKSTNEFVLIYDQLINPNMKTSCSNANSVSSLFASFQLKMIDISNNNIMAKNVPALDIMNCIEFQQNAFVTYLQYNTNMLLGLSYMVNVILETPGDGVSYIPSLKGNDLTGINISPLNLVFTGYNVTNMSFFISSQLTSNSGSYVLHSNIYENTVQSFYLPILDQTINFVKASQITQYGDALLQKAIVSIENVNNLDNKGNPIEVSVSCSQNPADSLFFNISYNSSVLLITPSVLMFNLNINIATFSIQALRSDIPYQIINFSLYVANPYISTEDIPFILSQNSMNFTITQYNINNNLEIFGVKNSTISKNLATFQVYTSKPCTVFYLLTYYGSQTPSQAQILDNILYPQSKSFSNGSMNSQAQYNEIMDYIAIINFYTLEGNSQYSLYILAQDEFNITAITSVIFKTKRLSFSWAMKMNFLENVTFSSVQNALSLTLRLPMGRFYLLSDHQVNEPYIPSIMKPKPIIYEALIAPDPFNDEIQPRYYAQLMTTNTYIQTFKSILSEFNEVKGILAYEYRLNPPKLKIAPQKLWAKYYEVMISMTTVQRSKIYAIRITNPNPQLNTTQVIPLSQQIYKGMTPTNDYLNKTPFYVFKGMTDQNGYIEIDMKDLLDGNTYDVYITAGNNYPYDPPLLFNDDQVQYIRVSTPVNKSNVFLIFKGFL